LLSDFIFFRDQS